MSDRRWALRHLIVLALLSGAIGYWLSPWRAAEGVSGNTHVTHTERVAPRRIKVTLSDGSTRMLRPCRTATAPRDCYQRRINKPDSAPYVRLDMAQIIRVDRLP